MSCVLAWQWYSVQHACRLDAGDLEEFIFLVQNCTKILVDCCFNAGGAQVATYGLSTQDARAVALVAACAIAAPVARAAAEIWRRDFDKGVVSAAIDASMRSIGIGVIFLALII